MTGVQIGILVFVGVVFFAEMVAQAFHLLMFKSLVSRLEACEYKLQQIPTPAEIDEMRAEIAEEITGRDTDGEYVENRNTRETNSSGVPIARRGIVGDEPPAE